MLWLIRTYTLWLLILLWRILIFWRLLRFHQLDYLSGVKYLRLDRISPLILSDRWLFGTDVIINIPALLFFPGYNYLWFGIINIMGARSLSNLIRLESCTLIHKTLCWHSHLFQFVFAHHLLFLPKLLLIILAPINSWLTTIDLVVAFMIYESFPLLLGSHVSYDFVWDLLFRLDFGNREQPFRVFHASLHLLFTIDAIINDVLRGCFLTILVDWAIIGSLLVDVTNGREI